MGTYSGPNIVSSGLLLYTDSNNTKKSWKGAPTTNILPSPSINGRFTTANQWGTYNTNQYNSGQYFSIGTISSVDNNIVTTSSNHPLRTYDVVRAQTTGGGVTAGTDYFVKKIDNTRFSLHAYNSSQSGADGYINPNTGYHKVHDSIALDQRVSINVTSFPTMWWGAPHLPNSGLVKEIVQNAGPEGQSVMRLHMPRIDGVIDGMAYGVDTYVAINDIINVSYWARTNYPGKVLGYSTYFGPSYPAGGGSTSLTTSWQRVKHQWTSSNTYPFIQYWWPEGTTTRPYWIDMCDLQVEINTGTAASTPFTLSSRSNTQAVLDLANNNTLTASSLTYASNETYSFNGTSNYIDLGRDISWNNSNKISFTFALKPNSLVTTTMGFAGKTNFEWAFYQENSALKMVYWNASGGHTNGMDWTASDFFTSTTQFVIFQYVWDGTTSFVYRNGELVTSKTATDSSINRNTTDNAILGGHIYAWADTYWSGVISLVQIYNRDLSSTEIKNNFNSIRGRFEI